MNMYKVEYDVNHDELANYIAQDLDGELVEDSFCINDDDSFTIAVKDGSGAICHWIGNVDDLTKYKIDTMAECGAPELEFETLYSIESNTITQELA